MNMLNLDSKDLKILLVALLVLNSPPILVRVPFIGILMFIPMLFWISIPGIPLGLLGLPYFEIKEFGAIPRGIMGWGLVVLFWCLMACGLTLILKRARNKKVRS